MRDKHDWLMLALNKEKGALNRGSRSWKRHRNELSSSALRKESKTLILALWGLCLTYPVESEVFLSFKSLHL